MIKFKWLNLNLMNLDTNWYDTRFTRVDKFTTNTVEWIKKTWPNLGLAELGIVLSIPIIPKLLNFSITLDNLI